MKTKTNLEKEIVNITTKILIEYPELTKYIKEMPTTFSQNDKNPINSNNMEEYYNSLVELIAEYAKTHDSTKGINILKQIKFRGYRMYPPSEDIYIQGKKEMDLNPENPSKKKNKNTSKSASNEKTFKEDMSGDDLDVPGTELDDQQESVGSEDEENNYYSLGGDNHNDLEEDKSYTN